MNARKYLLFTIFRADQQFKRRIGKLVDDEIAISIRAHFERSSDALDRRPNPTSVVLRNHVSSQDTAFRELYLERPIFPVVEHHVGRTRNAVVGNAHFHAIMAFLEFRNIKRRF